MLLKLPVTYERNLLLSRIYFSQPNQSNLLRAEALLTTAISLQPASINARQLLTVVYRDENKLPQASWQAALVSKLQSGRP
jgi:cytochrome c-type biogenesis protein CcmH/NrfG